MDTLVEIIDKMPTWLNALTVIVTGASVVTAMTSTKSDDKVVNAVLKVLNFLALNVFKNKNKDDK